MAFYKVEEPASEVKLLASAFEQLSISGQDDTVEELQSDMNTTSKPQTSGKFRRTALRFFGVRKNICLLPALFGGRSKNQNKLSSKKGIGKSKTHDGLSKASCDDIHFEYLGQKEAGSSSHSDFNYATADQKSMSLPWQRRGFRSLFHSIKLNRNQRNSELEKNEMIALSSPLLLKDIPVIQGDGNKNVKDCLADLSEPDVPDCANIISDFTISPECIDSDVMALESCLLKQESLKSLFDDQTPDNKGEMELTAVVSSEDHENSRVHSGSCPQLQMPPEPKIKSLLPTSSSDQLNMVFGDVASLKSFDSLTGCGDIIADQDDDSIAESAVSGERSRNSGKRNSCYLTYQGGGEEMASPDELEVDSLHLLWTDKTEEELFCPCSKDHTVNLIVDLTSTHHTDFVNGKRGEQAAATDASPLIPDIMTPQSEHQESVPNSDEGYYDSTTPGPDEGQEKVERIRRDRLPRDSYSGDALYELFAPDESLVSPRYEDQSKLPSSEPCGYVVKQVDITDSAQMNRMPMGVQLYNDFPSMFQTGLIGLCSKSKEFSQFAKGVPRKTSNENDDLKSKHHAFVNNNEINFGASYENGNALDPTEERTKYTNARSEKIQCNISFEDMSDPDFDVFLSATRSEPKEQHLEEKKPATPAYRAICACPTISNDLDDCQTVCFSQALEDYTKHSQFLRNSHNNTDGMESSSSFATNMEALPTIVTFDVVDMHNEGEYDDQIHAEMEDISSSFQQFEESYLQKDAFAECDYHLLDVYEHNLFSNAWAIASLPRRLGLTKVSQSVSGPLSSDRRSRSLDTESMELTISNKHRGSGAAVISCPQTQQDYRRDYSLHDEQNAQISTLEVSDRCSFMSLPWQTKSDTALSPSLTDGKNENVPTLCDVQVKQTLFSCSSSTDCYNSTSQPLPSSDLEVEPYDLFSQNADLCSRQLHLPLQSNSSLPHSAFVFSEILGEDLIVRTISTNK